MWYLEPILQAPVVGPFDVTGGTIGVLVVIVIILVAATIGLIFYSLIEGGDT